MNKLLKIFVVFLFLCGCENKNTSVLTIEADNGTASYNVEIASTIEELQTGLMNRDSLPADGGMLFDLSVVNAQNTAMWMKDTKIALDMLFITPEGLIFWIEENTQPYSEELIASPFPAAAVLEINAGEVAKKGLRIGQVIKHPLFPMERKDVPELVVEEESNESETAIDTENSVSQEAPQETNSAPETTETEANAETAPTEPAEAN